MGGEGASQAASLGPGVLATLASLAAANLVALCGVVKLFIDSGRLDRESRERVSAQRTAADEKLADSIGQLRESLAAGQHCRYGHVAAVGGRVGRT